MSYFIELVLLLFVCLFVFVFVLVFSFSVINSEFSICYFVRHGNLNSKSLYYDLSKNGTLLYSSATYVAVLYNVTNRKLTIIFTYQFFKVPFLQMTTNFELVLMNISGRHCNLRGRHPRKWNFNFYIFFQK